MRNWRVFLFIGVWLLLIGAAMRVDVPVARWVDAQHPIEGVKSWWWLLRAPGIFWWTLGIGIALGCFHRWRWWAGSFLVLSGALSGINFMLKWCFGRHRPSAHDSGPFEFHPFHGGLQALIHGEKNLSMPSGDVALAAATVAALWILLPRYRVLWVAMGLMVMAQRILANAHYVSDTVAAAGLGVLCTWFARSIMSPPRAVFDKAEFSGTTTSPAHHIQ